MNQFKLWLSFGILDVQVSTYLTQGKAEYWSAEGNTYRFPPPADTVQVESDCALIRSIGETPACLNMHASDFAWLQQHIGPSGLVGSVPNPRPTPLVTPSSSAGEGVDRWAAPLTPKAPVCECGSQKAKLPFHSSWCPLAK